MISRLLRLTLQDFRAFRKADSLDLDADVVLIYSPNGVGKTSLVSAVELALTGEVSTLKCFENDYPRCLRNWAAKGPAQVRLTWRGKQAEEMSASVSVDGGIRAPKSTLPPCDSAAFVERCYLSQDRLSRLLEIYAKADRAEDPPLIRYFRELVKIDRLQNLIDGLHVATHKATLKTRSSAYRSLCEEEATLKAQELDLTRQREEIEARLQSSIMKCAIEVGQSVDSTWGERIDQEMSSVRHRIEELGARARKVQQLFALLDLMVRPNAELGGQASIMPTPSVTEMKKELEGITREFDSQTTGLAELLQLAPTGPAPQYPDGIVPRFELVRRMLDSAKRVVAEQPADCPKPNQRPDLERRLEQCRSAIGELSESAGSGQFADWRNILANVLGYINSEVCPICKRDYTELDSGPLRGHVEQELEQLRVDISAANTRRERLSTLEEERLYLEQMLRKADFAADAFRQVAAAELFITAIEHRFDQTRLSTLVTRYTVVSRELAEAEKCIERSTARQREIEIAETGIRDLAATLSLDWVNLSTESRFLEQRRNQLCEYESRRQEAQQAVHEELLFLEQVREILRSWVRAGEELERVRERLHAAHSSLSRVDRLLESTRWIVHKANECKSTVIAEVLNHKMNGTFVDLFRRISANRDLIPCILEPDTIRNRMRTRVGGVVCARGAEGLRFQDYGAVSSIGNLNTAALSLFLALNLVHDPGHQVLILDDPVQSMDEIHVSNFAGVLRGLAREAGRQLLVTVHDRPLLDYLALELAPSNTKQSLLVLELQKSSDGEVAIVPLRHKWNDDRLMFTQAG